MSRILVVDDIAAMAEQYAYDLKRLAGYATRVSTDGREALEMIENGDADCMILDLEMPGFDGFDVLEALAARGSMVPVIVYTGTGDYDRCARAVRLGAYGFIDKAEPMQRVVQEVRNALEHGKLKTEVRQLKARLGTDTSLIGESEAMVRLTDEIRRVAPIPSPVLIFGESGSGKELVARDLHALSRVADEPFVALNSAALPENLIESELFGHEKGAFTGADRMRKGAFERAGKGTLFLDEIGELPAAAQAKLLRVLENRQITRVGGDRTIDVDARVIAATHRNLEADAQAGRFRRDLTYRLNVHVLRVPPLRDRRSDIPALVQHFLATICSRFGIRTKRIDDDALRSLMAYDWRRNNVRELRNVVERMIIAADGDTLGVDHIPVEIRESAGDGDGDGDAAGAAARAMAAAGPASFQELKAEAERQIVLASLHQHDWHISRTAEALGLADHSSLLKIMKRHGIRREE